MNKRKIDWPLIIIPILAVFGLSSFLGSSPKVSQSALMTIRHFLNQQFSALYILVALFFVSSSLYVAFSKIGKLLLGDKNDRPEYSNLSWGVMIFTSKM